MRLFQTSCSSSCLCSVANKSAVVHRLSQLRKDELVYGSSRVIPFGMGLSFVCKRKSTARRRKWSERSTPVTLLTGANTNGSHSTKSPCCSSSASSSFPFDYWCFASRQKLLQYGQHETWQAPIFSHFVKKFLPSSSPSIINVKISSTVVRNRVRRHVYPVPLTNVWLYDVELLFLLHYWPSCPT